MHIIRDSLFIDPADRGAAAAIGNFDGVHLGHRHVIGIAQEKARELGVPSGVLTFEPHPREFLRPGGPPFRLMDAGARANRLARLGVERLYELPFNAAMVALTPREFAQEIVANRLGLRHLVVGADFHFGHGREGNAGALAAYGAEMGFGVTVAGMMEFDGLAVSSTAIRTALSEGRPRDAARMLGHWHRIEGPVIRGDQRGRELGFPTANMSIAGRHAPRFGVYAVLVDVLDGPHAGRHHGAASIGTRPMFGENLANCETYLLDFRGDLYGATLSVALVDWLRPEEKFDSLDALIAQMDADCARARTILDALGEE
ncbi:MAG: bifunctional riboflavin kinase/FAD synthetase [Rubellimicrobium sp.]|nr:bifunctional riboflavin kinase/FAD synthetase [Rubellimicrobium sp.]